MSTPSSTVRQPPARLSGKQIGGGGGCPLTLPRMNRCHRRILVVTICALLFFSQIALYLWNQMDLERPAKVVEEGREVGIEPYDVMTPLIQPDLNRQDSYPQFLSQKRTGRKRPKKFSTSNTNSSYLSAQHNGGPEFTHVVNYSTADHLSLVPVQCRQGLTREVESSLERAVTLECKKEIVQIACRFQRNDLYPRNLPRTCSLGGDDYGQYFGCYKENVTHRIFTDSIMNEFHDSNSPSTCINHCLRSGYEFAGVENAYECFCGNNSPEEVRRVPDPECNSLCAGNRNANCGAQLKINVYRTGFRVRVLENSMIMNSSLSSLRHRKGVPAPVRIAFVLTVNGRAVRQVRRLLKVIYRPHHCYLIHVDKRQGYLYRELSEITKKLQNVRMATNRFSTIWGGASLLSMLLASMQELLSFDDWNWDYFLNLSESDYPIKTVEELEMFLLENMGKNFVKSHGKDTPKFIRKQGLNMLFHECDNHMWRLGPRDLQDGIRIDGGSDWMCLTRKFTRYLIGPEDLLLTGLKAYWKHALLPGESFFHTVLQNSEFCTTIVNNNLHLTNWRRKQGCKCQYKHIVDWCGCSPNDFLIDDLQKLQNVRSRPIFFGRKFEAIINQEILNKVDKIILGMSYKAVPRSSFWLSEYHSSDVKTNSSSDDTVHSHYLSFARIAAERPPPGAGSSECPWNLRLDQLLEGTVYKHRDVFQGLVVTFNATRVDGDGTVSVVVVEALYQTTSSYNTVVGVEFPFRLQSVEVGTGYDPKEELFRNYGTLLGPHSDVVVKFVWSAGPAVTVTAVLVDPSGTLAASYDVAVSDTSSLVHTHPTDLRKPLRPGSWAVRILYKWIVVAETSFVVLPLSHITGRAINRATSMTLHSGPGRPYMDQDFSSISALVKLDAPLDQLRKLALTNSAKHGTSLHKWIDRLILERWSLSEGCVVGGGAERSEILPKSCKMEACERVSWSTRYPDINSDFGGVDQETGLLT